jgi:hypothetical protein
MDVEVNAPQVGGVMVLQPRNVWPDGPALATNYLRARSYPGVDVFPRATTQAAAIRNLGLTTELIQNPARISLVIRNAIMNSISEDVDLGFNGKYVVLAGTTFPLTKSYASKATSAIQMSALSLRDPAQIMAAHLLLKKIKFYTALNTVARLSSELSKAVQAQQGTPAQMQIAASKVKLGWANRFTASPGDGEERTITQIKGAFKAKAFNIGPPGTRNMLGAYRPLVIAEREAKTNKKTLAAQRRHMTVGQAATYAKTKAKNITAAKYSALGAWAGANLRTIGTNAFGQDEIVHQDRYTAVGPDRASYITPDEHLAALPEGVRNDAEWLGREYAARPRRVGREPTAVELEMFEDPAVRLQRLIALAPDIGNPGVGLRANNNQ